MREKIGKTIRRLREAKGESIVDLSRHLGVSSGTVSQWESGKSVPCRKNVLAIEKFFNVPDLRDQAILEVMEKIEEVNSLAEYFMKIDLPTSNLSKLDDAKIDLAVKASKILCDRIEKLKGLKDVWQS